MVKGRGNLNNVAVIGKEIMVYIHFYGINQVCTGTFPLQRVVTNIFIFLSKIYWIFRKVLFQTLSVSLYE